MNHSHVNKVLPCSGKYDEVEVLDTSFDLIFPTFFSKFKLNIDNESILNECFEFRDKFPKGVQKSNMNGWQSDVFSLFHIDSSLTPNIQNLAFNTILAANDVSENYKLGLQFGEHGCDWWININDNFSYNAIHSHPGCEIIALYYPKISSDISSSIDEGMLQLIRTDGSQQNGIYEKRPDFTYYDVIPEVGTIYLFPSHILHCVTPNKTNIQRVSIAFNLTADK
jgi:uncharacterized protein (TIGR02466 family)